MYHTHSKLSFILFFCNIKSSKKYHIKTAANLSAVFITMLITFFIITPPIQTFCHTKTDNTNISTLFSSDAVKQTLTLSETHYMLTNSAQLKQNILYKDTIKNNSVTYYYINNPAATNLFCIKCVSGKLTTNEIQFFDDTNNEINTNIIRQQNYFYIDIKKLLAKAPSATRIYITAGSRKTSNIEIIYTKNITTPKSNNNNADKKGIAKRNTQKSITQSNTKKKTYKKDTKKRIIKKAANKEDTKTHATKKSTTKKAPAKNKKNITAIHKKTVQKSKPKKNNIHNQNNKSRRKTNNNAAAKKSNKNKIAHHKTTDKNKSKNNIAHHKITDKNKSKNNITHHKTTDKNKTKNQNVNNKYVKFNTKFITLKSTKNTFLTYRTNIKITNKTKIIWTSSNTNIVSTNKHKITAHHKGLAIITLTIKDRTVCKKAICTIRVT